MEKSRTFMRETACIARPNGEHEESWRWGREEMEAHEVVFSVRQLCPAERSVPSTPATAMLPAVVDPPCASASLRDALASQSQQLLTALDAHGAVLLRGWAFTSVSNRAPDGTFGPVQTNCWLHAAAGVGRALLPQPCTSPPGPPLQA